MGPLYKDFLGTGIYGTISRIFLSVFNETCYESLGSLCRGTGRSSMGLIAVSLEQTIECFLLSNCELTRLNAGMIDTKQGVDVVHWLRSDISEFLDLRSGVLDLNDRKRDEWGMHSKKLDKLTWSSVSSRPSCSTRDLTAFHPVSRCLSQGKRDYSASIEKRRYTQ